MTNVFFQMSTLDRKKNKNFSFSRRFPFMKSREDGKNEDGSDQERKCLLGVIAALVHVLVDLSMEMIFRARSGFILTRHLSSILYHLFIS